MSKRLITVDPEIMSGTPVFNGTRVPVHTLFDWLETETFEDFLENFPSVNRQQAIEVLKLAEDLVTKAHLAIKNPLSASARNKISR